MPITVVSPQPGPIGPGFTVTLTSSLPALPVGGQWIHLFTSTTRQVNPNLAREQIIVPITNSNSTQAILQLPKSTVTDNTSLSVDESLLISSTIVDLNNITQDQGQWPSGYHWDPTTGLQQLIPQQTTTGGGLTEQEHTWLDSTQAAVVNAFTTISQGLQAIPIGDLLAHPDPGFWSVWGNCESLTGRGTLSLPGQFTQDLLYGIIITFQVVPPGMGKVSGAVDEYTERICQFVATYATVDGKYGYFGEIKDVYANNTMWAWQRFNPKQLLYDVTPGCQIQVCWLGV